MSTASRSGHFLDVRCTFPIHLHPSRLKNIREGVEEQLNSMLMSWNSDLNGILLSYSDLDLTSSPDRNPLRCGFIFQERAFIHFNVECRALVYRISVGEVMEAVVNAVAYDHLALLIHGTFACTIPLAGNLAPKSWQFDTEKERWIDQDVFKGDAAGGDAEEKDEDADDEAVKEEDATVNGTSTKKLTKKELKKLERRRLRDVMLAATGRGASSRQARPPAGVISRGVHIRFEVSSIAHSEEYFKLTGMVVQSQQAKQKKNSSSSSSSSSSSLPLGLTGGFTPLAPVESISIKKNNEEEDEENGNGTGGQQDADGDFDMSALAAVTAPNSAVKASPSSSSHNNNVANHASSSSSSSAPAPAVTPAKKQHTDAQQAKFLKKQAKMAERLAAKKEETTTTETESQQTQSQPPPPPTTEKKKRKNTESSENGNGSESTKKVKKVKVEK